MHYKKYKIVDGAAPTSSTFQVDSSGNLDEASLDIEMNFYSWPQNPRITGARIYIIGHGVTADEAEQIIEDP